LNRQDAKAAKKAETHSSFTHHLMATTVVYVDVDDTLIRSVGTKRVPIPSAIERVRSLHRDGATLYLWSTGGAEYARKTATELGLVELFAGFLPKPNIIIDDQHVHEWRGLVHERPY
jgi:cation transport ATPase